MTSQPRRAFVAVYERLAGEGFDAVVSLHLAPVLSGTLASAEMAARTSAFVAAIDSKTPHRVLVCSLRRRARMRDEGAEFPRSYLRSRLQRRKRTSTSLPSRPTTSLRAAASPSRRRVRLCSTSSSCSPSTRRDVSSIDKVKDQRASSKLRRGGGCPCRRIRPAQASFHARA